MFVQICTETTTSICWNSLQCTIIMEVHAIDAYFQLRHLPQHVKDAPIVEFLVLVNITNLVVIAFSEIKYGFLRFLRHNMHPSIFDFSMILPTSWKEHTDFPGVTDD